MKGIKVKFGERFLDVTYYLFFFILIFAIMGIILSVNTSAFSGSGSGTEGDPYQITNCSQLQEIGSELNASYELANNIDCSGFNWTPIGSSGATMSAWDEVSGPSPFTGDLDGNNHSISNLSMVVALLSPNGLFGYTSGASIKNVNIVNISIVKQYDASYGNWDGITGPLIGVMEGGTVDNCTASGSITQINNDWNNGHFAGLIGFVDLDAHVDNSSSSVNISLNESACDSIGGFVAIARGNSVIEDSHSSGNINLGVEACSVGGFIGRQTENAKTYRSYSTGTVHVGIGGDNSLANNSDTIGGFAGAIGSDVGGDYVGNTVVENCFSTGDVIADGAANELLGGFVGEVGDGGVINKSYSTGDVRNTGEYLNVIGGFAAYTRVRDSGPYPQITQCYSTGDVIVEEGDSWDIGGFIGEHRRGTISNSYTRSSITATTDASHDLDSIGGFVGSSTYPISGVAQINNSYSAASINVTNPNETTNFGGFVGYVGFDSLQVSSSYWDTTLSGTSSSPAGGTGLSTSAMKTQSSFSGWDFSTIWDIDSDINDGYPNFLRTLSPFEGTIACGQQCSYDAQCAGSLYPYTCDEVTDHPELNKCELVESYCTAQSLLLGLDECSCVSSLTPTPTLTSTITPTPTLTSTITITPTLTGSVTPTDTITGTPTGTLTVTGTGTIPPITTIILPSVTLPTGTVTPTIINESECEADFSNLKVSSTIVEPSTKINILWATTEQTDSVYFVQGDKLLEKSGSFSTTLEETTDFTFIAQAEKCQTVRKIHVEVVDTLPWENSTLIGATAFMIEAGTAVIVSLLSLSGSDALNLFNFGMSGNMFFSLLGMIQNKKKKKWGVVYDAATKKPISKAIVRMLNNETDEVVETVVTDVKGVFSISPKEGKYMLKVVHPKYIFPSKIVTGKDDGGYTNVYGGGIIKLKKDDEQVIYSIPLDPRDMTDREAFAYKAKQIVSESVMGLSTVLVVVGFLYSIYAAYVYPHIYNYITVAVYLVMFVFKLFVIIQNRKSTYGVVTDEFGDIISGLEIGLYDSEFNTLLYRTFTNSNGEYNFAVSSNSAYVLKIMDSNYDILDKNIKKDQIMVSKGSVAGVRLITKSFSVTKG